MQIVIHYTDTEYAIDINHPLDISIPVNFDGPQPNTYGVPAAMARAYEDGKFIGDVRRGGSCNFEEYHIVPHCNGTHTECVGHISKERIAINTCFERLLIPATLITIEPEKAVESTETYSPDKQDADRIITAKSLFYKLHVLPREFMSAVIIRTTPNDSSKKTRDYMKENPPFFSMEAMDYLFEIGVEHLLVDMPSVDRLFDEGKLSAHHVFWGVPQGSHDVHPEVHSRKTITEMVYVDNAIADGFYFINIQIPNFVADAAPSRVFMYSAHQKNQIPS